MKNKNKADQEKADWLVHRTEASFSTGLELAPQMLTHIEQVYSKPPRLFDLALMPLCLTPGTLSILAALPSQGKSTFLMNLAVEALEKKYQAAVFLPEYGTDEFMFKAICSKAKVPLHKVFNGRMTREDWPALTEATAALVESGLYLSRMQGMSAGKIATEAELLNKMLQLEEKKLNLIIVDSANYVNPYDEPWLAPLEILRKLAQKLNAAVVCSYAVEPNEKLCTSNVKLGDLRLAGINETMADHIFFLHRPEYYNREDITLKGKAVLRQLHPWLTGGDRDLRFNNETLAFSRPEPIVLPTVEELF